jgi:hypothetical protein
MLARHPLGRLSVMKLSDWLDEYRDFNPDDFERPLAVPVDVWKEPELIASADRVPNTEPRWRERAARVGYGRPTQI